MKIFLFGFGFIFVTLIFPAFGNAVDDVDVEWVKPRAWDDVSHVSRNLASSVRSEGNCPQDETYVFYMKLVNFLFDSRKLIRNNESGKLSRVLRLEMSPKLLEKLREAETARDIDSIVFEIVEMSRESKIEQVTEVVISIADIISFYASEIYNSDTLLFVFLAVVTLFFVWFVSRSMRWNIVMVFLLTILSISFFLTYLDCNRKLEIKKLMELSKANERNPCEVKKSYFNWYSYSEDDCFKHMTDSYGSQRSICRPTEVFLQFFSHLTLTQFITFVEESHVALRDIFNNYSWHEKLVVLPVVLLFTYLVLSTVFKYCLKYLMPVVISKISDHGESSNSQATLEQNQRNYHHPHIIGGGLGLGGEDSDHLVLSGESVRNLLKLLTQKSTVTLKEAEGALETEDGDRVQVLPVDEEKEASNQNAIQCEEMPKDAEITGRQTAETEAE